MGNKSRILGIIPARGGSKRIPKKNIIKLKGQPLISYTINAGLKSKKIDRLVVSTDDREIARVSKDCGAEVMMRPENLARDETPTLPIIRHVIKELEKSNYSPDMVMILQPTSPMRTSVDIDNAIGMMLKKRADSLVSVCLANENARWTYTIRRGNIEPFTKTKKHQREQTLLVYKKNGAIYLAKKDTLMKNDKVFDRGSLAFVMPKERSIDIDEPIDLKTAEMLLRKTT